MERITLFKLITIDLGYCCEYAFFKRNKQTGMIAARLGVSERAVRYHKVCFNNGDYTCQNCPNCLKAKKII